MHFGLKRVIATTSAAIIAVTALTGTITASAVDIIASGQCGESVNWTLDSDGVLTISGNGPMYQENYFSYDAWTYSKYANQIKELKFEDGITEIGTSAFCGWFSAHTEYPKLTKVSLPSTLKKIGWYAFKYINMEEIFFPKSLTYIGEGAFAYTQLQSINLHEDMSIGGCAFSGIDTLKEVTIPKNITFLKTGISGQGMARAHSTFSNCTGLEKIIIEDGQNGLVQNLCKGCTSLKTVIIGGNVDYISTQTFDNCPSLSDMYFYTPDLSTIEAKGANNGNNESIDSKSNPTYYVIKDSKTETTLRNAGYLTDDNVVYIASEDDINKLNEAIEKNADTSKFTEDYIKKLTDAVSSGKEIIDKYDNDKFSGITLDEVNKSLNVLENPEYIPSNYTSVDEAIAKADKLDLSKYTDESVKALQEAINAVEKNLDITDQDKVNAFAKAIEDAIKGLVEKKSNSNTPNNSGTSKNPNVKPATSVPITTRSPSQVAKDRKNAENKVKQAKITKLKAKSKSKKKITVSWRKVKKAVGYEIQVSKNRKFKKNLFDKFTTKKKITFKKKLKSGKTYYIRARAYATYKDAYGKPQKVFSRWIKKIRKVKVK